VSNETRTAEKVVARTRTRKMPLFTRGKHPEIDRLKMCADLFCEMKDNERLATLGWLADTYGYVVVRKSRW
jgi:hypothetical protein